MRRMVFWGVSLLLIGSLVVMAPGAEGWSKEGHMMTCQIAQSMLNRHAAHVVENLLPEYVQGDLSALCVWPDQIRHWYKYRWSSPLHFIDTPDNDCNFDYARDCHDQHGNEDMCVAGAVMNYTTQLSHYKEGSADRKYNLTEALLFLSHFMGDVHQPMHCSFTSDSGGNTINLRWYRRKSNLHHVWDRDIILTAMKEYYDNNMDEFRDEIQKNITDGAWADDLRSWEDCHDQFTCPNKYATESINLACKWAYKNVTEGMTLSDEYFLSRLPIIEKRIAQGGVRLAMTLNRLFGEEEDSRSFHKWREAAVAT